MKQLTDIDRAHNAEFFQFSRLNREQRLAALKAAQETHGVESKAYQRLAGKHHWMLQEQFFREE
jgi:hypothetical protein